MRVKESRLANLGSFFIGELGSGESFAPKRVEYAP